jgi:hypothetical protein
MHCPALRLRASTKRSLPPDDLPVKRYQQEVDNKETPLLMRNLITLMARADDNSILEEKFPY